MSSSNSSTEKNYSKSIYDVTNKIEEELTYIYEMRMKSKLSSENQDAASDKSNSKKSINLMANQPISIFAR